MSPKAATKRKDRDSPGQREARLVLSGWRGPFASRRGLHVDVHRRRDRGLSLGLRLRLALAALGADAPKLESRRDAHGVVGLVLREGARRVPRLPATTRGAGLRRVTRPALWVGMTSPTAPATYRLPHHKLIAYHVAIELLVAVKAAQIKDAKLRDQALRAAKGACLNIAEAAARVSLADRARVFGIARGEAAEAAAAVEIAAVAGDASAEDAERCVAVADRLVALLSGLARR